jgi:hypothetical protein
MLLADRASQSSPLISTEPVGGASTMAAETSDAGKPDAYAYVICAQALKRQSNAQKKRNEEKHLSIKEPKCV